MSNLRLTVALAAALAWSAASAQAHAFLEHAEPPVGAKCKSAPAEVRIAFSEKLEAAFSSIKVSDAAGQQVDKNDTRLEAGQAALLRVSLTPLKPGLYRVTWRVVSVDTHVTKGSFSFEVSP